MMPPSLAKGGISEEYHGQQYKQPLRVQEAHEWKQYLHPFSDVVYKDNPSCLNTKSWLKPDYNGSR